LNRKRARPSDADSESGQSMTNLMDRFAAPFNPMHYSPSMSSIHNQSPWNMNTPGSLIHPYLHSVMPVLPNMSNIPQMNTSNEEFQHDTGFLNPYSNYFPGVFNMFDPNTPQFPRVNLALSPINYPNAHFENTSNSNLQNSGKKD
jgi:hypothetical protein